MTQLYLKYFLSFFLSLLSFVSIGQNIAINTSGSTAATGSGLDIDFSNKGLLIPRVSLANSSDLMGNASLPTSLIVYKKDVVGWTSAIGFYYWNGSNWIPFSTGGLGWSVLGNAGTVDGTNFLGTTDNIPFNFRVNNQKAGRIDNPASATYNTFLGYQSGNANTSGPHNTFIGYLAGSSNTTADSNTFVGSYAGKANTTGQWNTAVGAGALYQNISGPNNTAVGQFAMAFNTLGNDNTAVGAGTLYHNTTQEKNTAFGSYALYTSTAGYNTAFGCAALFRNETGTGNTALGEAALYNNRGAAGQNTAAGGAALYENVSGTNLTAVGAASLYGNFVSSNNTAVGAASMRNSDGANNTAVGMNTLYYSTGGTNNTVMGYQAGYGVINQSHSNNSFFGYRTGFGITTGSNNLLFGYQSGDAITTGSNNIIIGYDIDAPSATGSNQMSIGNLIYATGVDGTGTTVSTGKVGIGRAAPSWLVDAEKNQNAYTLYSIRNPNAGNGALSGMIMYNDLPASAGILGLSSSTFSTYPILGTNKVFLDANASMNGIVINNEGALPIIFGISSTEKMRLDGTGNLGVGNTSPPANAKVAIKDGHLQVSQTTAPTIATIADAGSVVSLGAGSNDMIGVINLTTDASPTLGEQCRITFNKAYTTAPIVVFTATNAVTASAPVLRQIYVSSTTTTFSINFGATPGASSAYQWNYMIIEP